MSRISYREMQLAIDAFVNAHKTDVSYPNSDFFKWHNKLTGSCKMGRKWWSKIWM